MTYCERCGFANRQGSHYCNACGFRLVSELAEVDEPLPGWLRQATVAGYLWKGEELLPDWLASVRPFRELYGGGAVVLPPPFEEVVDESSPSDRPYAVGRVADENAIFDVDDEEGPIEGDLLLLDDLELTTATMEAESTFLSSDVSTDGLESTAQVGLGSQTALDTDAVAGVRVDEDGEGESILEVLSAVLQPDDSHDQDVRVSAEEPRTSPVPPLEQLESVDVEIAPPVGAQIADDGVVSSQDPVPDSDLTSFGSIPAAPQTVESNGAPASAVSDSTGDSARVRPESDLGENGRRFESAAGYVLKPQPERSPRKARRKRKK